MVILSGQRLNNDGHSYKRAHISIGVAITTTIELNLFLARYMTKPTMAATVTATNEPYGAKAAPLVPWS